jgi:hypothetical protein
VLNGTFPSSAITNTSAFVPTALTNPLFTNVTGGQVVEGVTSGDNVVFYSGLLTNSTVTTAVCDPLFTSPFRPLIVSGCKLYWWCDSHH